MFIYLLFFEFFDLWAPSFKNRELPKDQQQWVFFVFLRNKRIASDKKHMALMSRGNKGLFADKFVEMQVQSLLRASANWNTRNQLRKLVRSYL